MANLLDLIRYARSKDASDIHLVAGLPPAIRVNGEISMIKANPLAPDMLKTLVYDMLTDVQKDHFEREKELCFSIDDDQSGRVRITVYYHWGKPELSVRLLPLQISDPGTLGIPIILTEKVRIPNGLILIAGPTGMGKTTTLNYLVDQINRERRCKIVTIEDPVEFVHKPIKSIVVQQEIYLDALSFPRALVHVLRQNPDVIVIGEMRELETISTALTAAETGHLVLATLHTPNVMQTMERITSVFPPDQQKLVTLQLANCLQCIVVQDLVPRANRQGRILACEVLIANAAVRSLIRDNKAHMLESVLSTGRKDGMISMDMCLIDLYQKALISYDTAMTRLRDPALLTGAYRGHQETE
ncbi:MAG: PilT/PilU family type 4a pilus ATPase [Candidatus Sumerlaeota bacterium]|nr:PilT/PilU family type 4a pilus ATPase [Candidatus Sumerlaeota bacterium]